MALKREYGSTNEVIQTIHFNQLKTELSLQDNPRNDRSIKQVEEDKLSAQQ